uniref:Uncharacterized protein n=1 Tax=Oryza barthii TaxID=65489 RepID=A0A0D3G7K5_9ORYZ
MAITTAERDGVGEEQKKRKQGGFRTMPFILANEICDRFATAGFGANLITYLTQQLHLPLVEASNTLTNFNGTSSLTPILGALAADAFAGRFWTIIAGSVFYQLGMLALVASALLPSLRPAPCAPTHGAASCRRATGWQLAVLYLALLCTSLGSGGIAPAWWRSAPTSSTTSSRSSGRRVAVARRRRRRGGSGATSTSTSSRVGLAVLLALTVVVRRRGAAADHGLLDSPAAVVPISVFWLVPQYAVHGVAEAFSSVAHMEFLYDQAPESMRSSAAALFWLSSSLGNYMGTVLVTAVQRATRGGGEWLQDNINRGRLDCYYWLVTTLMVLNLGYYLVCFHFYTMKPLEVAEEDDDEEECELSSVHKNGGPGGLV